MKTWPFVPVDKLPDDQLVRVAKRIGRRDAEHVRRNLLWNIEHLDSGKCSRREAHDIELGLAQMYLRFYGTFQERYFDPPVESELRKRRLPLDLLFSGKNDASLLALFGLAFKRAKEVQKHVK